MFLLLTGWGPRGWTHLLMVGAVICFPYRPETPSSGM
jgi:hypothetical protein